VREEKKESSPPTERLHSKWKRNLKLSCIQSTGVLESITLCCSCACVCMFVSCLSMCVCVTERAREGCYWTLPWCLVTVSYCYCCYGVMFMPLFVHSHTFLTNTLAHRDWQMCIHSHTHTHIEQNEAVNNEIVKDWKGER